MKVHLVPLVVAVALAAGCATTQTVAPARVETFTSTKPSALRPLFRALYVEGERNAVLNLNYLGLAAMESGQFGIAEKAFDKAIQRIDAIYADDPNAARARSLWSEEKVKDFKGEPYERALTHYYRGVLYLRKGDYQNARAMFLAADYQDTVGEKESYAGDFGMMNYLAAWASHCDGDKTRAEELLARAVKAQPDLWSGKTYAYSHIALIDSGPAPTKRGTGKYREMLVVDPSPLVHEVTAVSLVGARQDMQAPILAGDVNFQATTRGGRPVQAILNGKASFKSATGAIGDVATTVGMQTVTQGALYNDRNMANAGAVFAAIGLLSQIASAATTPAADTRAWSSIPSRVYLMPGHLAGPGTAPRVQVTYDAGGGPVGGIAEMFSATSGQCGVSWTRTETTLPGVRNAMVVAESSRTDKDDQFRAMLESDFGATALAAAGDPK